jgi:hypothetical protein
LSNKNGDWTSKEGDFRWFHGILTWTIWIYPTKKWLFRQGFRPMTRCIQAVKQRI